MANSQTSSFGRSLRGSTPPASSRHPELALADVVAVRYGGLLPAAALREVGVTPNGLRRLCSAGVLHGIRRGVYVSGERWRAADADERYRLLVRATVLAAGHSPVLSHQSAAALHGLPTIGGWPDTVHALTPDATGGSNAAHVTGHRGPAPDAVDEIAGCQVTRLARTLVDVAVTSSFLVAVTMLDHALRVEQERQNPPRALALPGGQPGRPALTRDDLYRELDTVNPRTGRRRAERAIRFADPLSANPGESLSRVRIFQLGFELPELQVCFPDIEGRNAYVDFWWRRVRKIGEFDGYLKYGAGSVLGDRDPGTVVWAEKKREDALRARAASFDRWGWELALSPERFHAFLTERGVPRA